MYYIYISFKCLNAKGGDVALENALIKKSTKSAFESFLAYIRSLLMALFKFKSVIE